MAEDPPRYRFGPRSTRGLVAGWSGGQLASVAVAVVIALGVLKSVGGIVGAGVALAIVGVGLAVSSWPVAGRPVQSWLPTAARYAVDVAADGRLEPWKSSRARRRTRCLDRLSVRAVSPDEDRSFGVVVDDDGSTWSAAVPVGGLGYALSDERGRAEAVAAWAGVLAAMAADQRDLVRLQWIARTYPACLDGPTEVTRPPAPTGRHAKGRTAPFAARAYERFVEETAARLWNREVLVVLSTRAPRQAPTSRANGAGESEAARRLARLCDLLAERLAASGLAAGHPLEVVGLVSALRRAYDLDGPVAAPSWPFPIGVEPRWASLRTDGCFHVTYWVSEWPRSEVGPGVLLPLLIGSGRRRTVAVTMAPLGPLAAVRRAERERTSGAADAELRRRHGFAATARARAEQDLRAQREAELAEGHAAYLFSGYVTVTAADEASLEKSCAEVEQAAALARLELRRLYGAQEAAWCCTLPAGRGCG